MRVLLLPAISLLDQTQFSLQHQELLFEVSALNISGCNLASQVMYDQRCG